MRNLGTLNESSIYKRSSDLSQISDLELLREVYKRSQTDKVSSNTMNSVSILGTQKSRVSKSPKGKGQKLLASTKSWKEPNYFLQDSDSELNIREKLKKVQEQTKRFISPLEEKQQPITEISEISKSLDSDEESSSSKGGTQHHHSDYKAVQSATEAIRRENWASMTPDKKTQNPQNFKYRNSNVVSFGKGHFSVYQKTSTEKGISIMEGKDEVESLENKEKAEIVNRTDVSPLMGEMRKEDGMKGEGSGEDKKNTGNEESSLDKVSKTSRGRRKTLHHVISNFYLAKKFISILRNATIFRRPKWLNPIHFKMINDHTFYREGWLDSYQETMEDPDISAEDSKTFFKMFSSFRNHLKKRIAQSSTMNRLITVLIKMNVVFHPTRAFRVIWDTLHLIIIICYFYLIPINLSFGMNLLDFFEKDAPHLVSTFKYFTMCIFFLDIFMNFNTAYYNKGELIYDRKKIADHYLKRSLLNDLLSLLYVFLKIFIAKSNDQSVYFHFDNLLAFLFLLRMRNLNHITARIEEFMLLDETFFNLITLIKLIFGVLLLSHFFACFWHYISFVNLDDEQSWLNVYHLAQEVWWKKYISSYYFVVVVMNTVGFGDIVPQTYGERLYSIFFIYFACGIFAYTLNSIGMIVQDINKSRKIYKRNLHLINAYMKQKKITFDLRVRIRKYFEYIWKEESTHNEDETQEIINKLSKSLKDELLFEGNGTILKRLPVFNKNFTQESLRKLVYEMNELSFTPGELIYAMNESDDPSLFIVRKGEVELFVETPRFLEPITVTRVVKAGEVFGEISFFTGKERETFARSSTFTSVYIIKKQDFVNIVQGNPEDYQSFCELRDNVSLYEEHKSLFMKCSSCKARDHDSLSCPLLHLRLSKARILHRFNYSQPHPRMNCLRKRKRGPNALKDFPQNEHAAFKLMRKLMEDDDEDLEEDEVASSEEIQTEISKSDPTSSNIARSMVRLVSDITEEETIPPTLKETVSQRKASPKFTENSEMNGPNTGSFRSNYLRSFSKKSLKANKDVFAFDVSSNDLQSSSQYRSESKHGKKSDRYMFRKHLTLANPGYQRQSSKESLSKYSINSKKSSNSKSSFRPQEISRNLSRRDIYLKSPALKGSQRGESMVSIQKLNGRNKSDDSFIKDISILLKKERRKKMIITDLSIPSKESKQKSTSTMLPKEQEKMEETLYERMMKTLTETENNLVYDLLKSFEFYFPHNNVENVVSCVKEAQEKKSVKKKKMTKLNTKKHNELTNLINYNAKSKKTQFNRKKEESEMNIDLDKAKLIKILKEQEKKSAKKKSFGTKVLEFLKIREPKQKPLYSPQRKSIVKKK